MVEVIGDGCGEIKDEKLTLDKIDVRRRAKCSIR